MPFIHKPTPEEIDQAVQDHKTEILNDMGTAISSRSDVMPLTVPDFSSLHDYVDANTYAGFCGAEDGGVDRSNWFDPDSEDSARVLNLIQDRVDEWLTTGQAYRERIAMPALVDNENALDGWRCPKCGNEGTGAEDGEPFMVDITSVARVSDEGTDSSNGEEEFGATSPTQCERCHLLAPQLVFTIEWQQANLATLIRFVYPDENEQPWWEQRPYSTCIHCGEVIVFFGGWHVGKQDSALGFTPNWADQPDHEHEPKWLTLGELRDKTAHLPDWYPVTVSAQELEPGTYSDWYNARLGYIPTLADVALEPTSLQLDIIDTFDTRQW